MREPPTQVSHAIHLAYWAFQVLDQLGVEVVLKESGAAVSFDDLDFGELPDKEPGLQELDLAGQSADAIREKFIGMRKWDGDYRFAILDYQHLRKQFPRDGYDRKPRQ